jgi:hypothetical protein
VSTSNDSLLQRVQSSYQRLAAVASDLNTVSDELGTAINALDEALKRLNLGVTSWYRFAGDESESGAYWAHYIGYDKVGAKWGIALRKVSSHHEAPPDFGTEEEWLFNDAPRQFRMDAVEHIPAMLDKLIDTAAEAVEKVKSRTGAVKEFAAALAPPPRARRPALPPEPPGPPTLTKAGPPPEAGK